MTTTWETVQYEVDRGVATVTLNRPERMNAWNAPLARELSRALDEADADDGVRAVVVTGAGRAFCPGPDLERGAETFDTTRNESRRNREDEPLRLPYDIR